MNTHDLHTEQAMPTPNTSRSIQSLVRADLETREQIGRERYGTSLQAHNGRDALRDAYEEALDLACYLRQAIEERPMTSHEVPDTPKMPRRRLRSCVERWPGAETDGDYDPRCCRFPKSCSASVYDDDQVSDEDLEPSH